MGPHPFQLGSARPQVYGPKRGKPLSQGKGRQGSGPTRGLRKEFAQTGRPHEEIDQETGLAQHHAHPTRFKGTLRGDSVKFNEAAQRVMKKHGVPTLDLYTPSKKNMKEWMREANVHYFPHGSKALAEIVAKDVLERLKD